MSEDLGDARHLTYSSLDLLWNGGAPLILPVQGSPVCELRIDPAARRITLVTDYEAPEPELSNLRNISFEAVSADPRDLAQITVRVGDNVHSAYGLLTAIADGVQIEKSPLAVAVAAGVAGFKDMLTARRGFTPEEEVGLFGELAFLEFLLSTIGAGPAVEAWQGPFSEEHDFVFSDGDLEIKTTVSERRRHVINGLTQLVPLRGVPLSVISIQITRAASDVGRTLPSVVARVRNLATGHVVALDRRLDALGWSTDDIDLYPTFWALRTQPRAYRVDDDFPAMTSDLLAPIVPNFGLLSDVSYKVDLTDLNHDALPHPISSFVEPKGQ
jgi:hypothetical protein